MPADARDRLTSDPFTYRVTKDGHVLISRGGRLVTTVAGAAADKLLARLDAAADEPQVQQLLARATGHYRHGNERR
jgi:hypothetical protein